MYDEKKPTTENGVDEFSKKHELTAEEIEAVESAELPPEEASLFVEQATEEVNSLNLAGLEMQKQVGNDKEAVASLVDITKQAESALDNLKNQLIAEQEDTLLVEAGQEQKDTSQEKEGFEKGVQFLKELLVKYANFFEAEQNPPFTEEEQAQIENCVENIQLYAEKFPAESLRYVASDKESPDLIDHEVIVPKVYKAVEKIDPENCLSAFEELLRKNTSWKETAIKESTELYAKDAIRSYDGSKIELAKAMLEQDDIEGALRNILSLKDAQDYLGRETVESLGSAISEKIKKKIEGMDLNQAIDYWKSMPEMFRVSGVYGDHLKGDGCRQIIYEKALGNFKFGPELEGIKEDDYEGMKRFHSEQRKFLLQVLKDVPDVMIDPAFSKRVHHYSRSWEPIEQLRVVSLVIDKGEQLDRIFNDVQLSHLPEEAKDLTDKAKNIIARHIIKKQPYLLPEAVSLFGAKEFLEIFSKSSKDSIDAEHKIGLLKGADLRIYKIILSPDSYAILEKSVSRFQEPLTGSGKDKIRPLILTLAEKNDNFCISDSDMEIFASYLDKFGVQPTEKLFEYFLNIKKVERKEMEELPKEQLDNGLDSVEKISERLQTMKEKIIAGEIPLPAEMSALDYDILAVESTFHTSHFARSHKNLSEMHSNFQAGADSGKIKPLPAEYAPIVLSVERVKVSETSLDSCGDEYKRYRTDILAAEKMLKPEGFEESKKEIMGKIESEISALGVETGEGVSEARLVAQKKRIEVFNSAVKEIVATGNIDTFLKAVLKLENNLGIKKETSYTTPYLRRMLFAKTMTEFSGYANLNEALAQNESPTLDGVRFIRDIMSNALKEHVLNDAESGEYFSKENALTPKELSKLRKIFPSENIQKALSKIEGDIEGSKEKLEMIPDRSFTGELAGYYSDACYTRIDDMLQKWPDIIPCKFVRSRDDATGKELIGAVILIESVSADNKPVLIVRANNPRDKFLDTMQAESFCGEVVRAATEYASKRGLEQVLISTAAGTDSNRDKIKNYVAGQVKEDATTVKLRDSLPFNGYEIQDSCILAAEIK